MKSAIDKFRDVIVQAVDKTAEKAKQIDIDAIKGKVDAFAGQAREKASEMADNIDIDDIKEKAGAFTEQAKEKASEMADDIDIDDIKERAGAFVGQAREKASEVADNIDVDKVKKEAKLLIRTPWYYWYTGEKKVAVASWLIGALIPTTIFAIVWMVTDSTIGNVIYLIEVVFAIILDSLVWLVIGFIYIILALLPEGHLANTISEYTTQHLIIPMMLMGVYALVQSRFITRGCFNVFGSKDTKKEGQEET